MNDTATVSLMVTDIVGSTRMRTGRGDGPAKRLVDAHNALVREEIRRHSGSEIKTIGDSFMVAFDSARKAVDCAIGVQQAVAEHNVVHPAAAVQVRIGINTGECIRDGADLVGSAVDAAFRIALRAEGGQILVSELARGVIGYAAEFQFVEAGRRKLKGFPHYWRLYTVPWARQPAALSWETVTMLVNDIQGSTGFFERLGDEGGMEIVRACGVIVRAQVAAAGGSIEKGIGGDGFIMTFTDPMVALMCASAIQSGLAAYNNEHAGTPLRVGVGVHTGPVVHEADDIFGIAVITAFRVGGAARGGEVVVSDATRRLLPDSLRFGEPRIVEIMGRTDRAAGMSRCISAYCYEGQAADGTLGHTAGGLRPGS